MKIKAKSKCGIAWIIIWTIVYLGDVALGLKEPLCNRGWMVMNGEYYRILTGLLLHVNIVHALVNIIAIYFVCEFLNGQVKEEKLFLFSLITGTVTNAAFSFVSPYGTRIIGGSPVVFALIGFILISQLMRKSLPRFQLGTWYGNWIVGYAVLGNLPFFSGNASTLIIHLMALAVGAAFGALALKGKIM